MLSFCHLPRKTGAFKRSTARVIPALRHQLTSAMERRELQASSAIWCAKVPSDAWLPCLSFVFQAPDHARADSRVHRKMGRATGHVTRGPALFMAQYPATDYCTPQPPIRADRMSQMASLSCALAKIEQDCFGHVRSARALARIQAAGQKNAKHSHAIGGMAVSVFKTCTALQPACQP